MRKKKVLVIDDDEMNLQIAKMILEKRRDISLKHILQALSEF